MHDDGAYGRGHGDLFDFRFINANGQHQTAEHARCNIVRMHGATGDRFALHGKFQ